MLILWKKNFVTRKWQTCCKELTLWVTLFGSNIYPKNNNCCLECVYFLESGKLCDVRTWFPKWRTQFLNWRRSKDVRGCRIALLFLAKIRYCGSHKRYLVWFKISLAIEKCCSSMIAWVSDNLFRKLGGCRTAALLDRLHSLIVVRIPIYSAEQLIF